MSYFPIMPVEVGRNGEQWWNEVQLNSLERYSEMISGNSFTSVIFESCYAACCVVKKKQKYFIMFLSL